MRFKNIDVDIDGHIYHILSAYQCNIFILQVYGIISVICAICILCQLSYIPVTIIGNTIYARVMASAVHREGLLYKLCRMNNRLTVYGTSDDRVIAFEGVPSMNSNKKLPIIICSIDELQQLEVHTGLHNLSDVQALILQDFDKANGIYNTSVNDIIADIIYDEPIITIDKLQCNLYSICTTTKSWLTSLIITDDVEPLQPNDIITGFIAANTNAVISDEISVDKYDDYVIIIKDNVCTKLTRKALYYVDDDLNIIAYSNNKLHESLIYGLRKPRPFLQDGIRIIHPFHLPLMMDPILSLMLVTTATIQQY
jgi:hypothetical protein